MLTTSRATQTSTAAQSNPLGSAQMEGNRQKSGGAAPAPAASSGGNNFERTKVVMREKKARCGSFTWKRLSGLDNLTDDNFKSEMNKRLEAKSRANIIGWEVVTAKSAQKMKTNKEDLSGSSLPIPGLDKSRKSEIYRKNLPLGLPKTIKSLDYESDQHTGPIVATRDETLKIFASPIKKTGLLETRDGSLRKSYKIIKDGLPPRRTEFDPRSLAAVDPDYLRKSLGLEKSLFMSFFSLSTFN